MRTRIVLGSLGLAAAAVGCGPGGANVPDPYAGFVDGTALDAKFLPSTDKTACQGKTPCYPAQRGFSKGKDFFFYNLGVVRTSALPKNAKGNPALLTTEITSTTPTSVGPRSAYDFGACSPGTMRGPLSGLPVVAAIAAGSQAVTPPTMNDIAAGDSLAVNAALATSQPGEFEIVSVSAVTATTFTATFARPHKAGAVLTRLSQADVYSQDRQYPVFDGLPLATSVSGKNVYPIVGARAVDGVAGDVCNDIKTAASIAPAGGTGGAFGATAGGLIEYRLWPVIDFTGTNNVMVPPAGIAPLRPGWSAGLQLTFLDGGAIPLDAGGQELAFMDGVIVDPTTGTSKTTDSGVIIVPARPGEAGYSPIVRIHDFNVPAGFTIVDPATSDFAYKSLCTTPGACPPGTVDMTQVQYPAFNTLFIVASPL